MKPGVRLVVRDNGVGLSPESIPALFGMFSQVDSSLDRSQGGLGIGLALVKGLVELHGGSVSAHSEGLGRGSAFVVQLPASLVCGQVATLAGAPVVPAARQRSAAGGPKILVVDDNRDAAQTLSMALCFAGYEVHTAFSGAQALQIGAREHPQAVVLDVGMPGMDGYETVRHLRRESWGRHAVVVAVTGWGQDEDKLDARLAGIRRASDQAGRFSVPRDHAGPTARHAAPGRGIAAARPGARLTRETPARFATTRPGANPRARRVLPPGAARTASAFRD